MDSALATNALTTSALDESTNDELTTADLVESRRTTSAADPETTKIAADVLERSAAYTAARSVLALIRTATTTWPTDIAQAARQRAAAMVSAIAQSLEHPPTSAARRRCVRNAIGNAIELSAITDVARAQGLSLGDSMQSAGRAMSLLGFAFHATLVPDE